MRDASLERNVGTCIKSLLEHSTVKDTGKEAPGWYDALTTETGSHDEDSIWRTQAEEHPVDA